MKYILLMVAMSLLGGCSTNTLEDIPTEESYELVVKVISEMGNNTDFEIVDSGINEDNRYYIILSDYTGLFIKNNQVYAVNSLLATDKDIKQSFELAMAIANPELTMGERNIIFQKVLRDGSHRDDKANYYYHERDGSILLEVKTK